MNCHIKIRVNELENALEFFFTPHFIIVFFFHRKLDK